MAAFRLPDTAAPERYDWHVALYVMAAVTALIIPLALALAGRPAVHAGPPQSIRASLREAVGEFEPSFGR